MSFARKAFIVRGGHVYSMPIRQANRLPTTAEKLGIERGQLVFNGESIRLIIILSFNRGDICETTIDGAYSLLPTCYFPIKTADMPILSNMFTLWVRSDSAVRCDKRRMANNKTHCQMPPVSSWRLRPRSRQNRKISRWARRMHAHPFF